MDSPPTILDTDHARIFDEMEQGFRLAGSRGQRGSRRLRLTLAGGGVTIEVAGDALFDRITPALAHLEVAEPHDDRVPDLSVHLWDADEGGLAGPPAAPGSDPTSRALISTSGDGRYVLQRRTHAVVMHDRARGVVVGWFRDVDRLPLYDRGRPLHPQLLLWNQDRGAAPLHAGLVAISGRGALFVGEGGSGKTTSTLACLCQGFDFLGDDYISLLERGRGRFFGHGVYGSTHVDPAHLERFPDLRDNGVGPDWENEDKTVVFLGDVFPGRLARESPVDALFLPTVRSGQTRVTPATPAQALLRLVQGALALSPHAGSRGVEALFALAAAVPAFWLDLGADLSDIPAVVAATLEGLPESRATRG